jgi:hypothetical protein
MTWLFACTIFLSSCLLFLVQPICAKLLLPTLGGAPAVWNTCMVFFQAGLLLGYCYAHFGSRFLGNRCHLVIHLLVLGAALLVLPVTLPRAPAPPEAPALWLIQTLALAVGLPIVAVAGSAPLLQRWLVSAGSARDPYFLYAASNLGSFAALILYPLLVEPRLTLDEQSQAWMLAYVGLIAASLACAACVFFRTFREAHLVRSDGPDSPVTPALDVPPSWSTRLRWLLLALVPSSLMLSVTTYLTTDIAAIPLLWIVPLGLYLLSFALVFGRMRLVSQTALCRWMPLVVIVLALMIFLEATEPIFVVLGLHLLGFFWLALVCHGALADTRPPAARLTDFYLWLAVGSVLGGAFNALLAPLLFVGFAEYPLMIALACLLRPSGPTRSAFKLKLDLGLPLAAGGLTLALIFVGMAFGLPPGPISVAIVFVTPLVFVYTFQSYPLRFGLGLASVFLAGIFYPGVHGHVRYRARDFFGIHRVTEQDGYRKLFHGNILHGQESLDPRRQGEPLTYYYRTGPIGQLLTALKDDNRLRRVGLVGLGTGALASYAQKGQHWTFFEIDPAVARIAAPETNLFTYLKRCPARVDVILGDARLTLNRHPDKFGLLVIDAFGSDAIPLHLLTREALQVYRAHLGSDGLLAFHVSNNYVDLEPVLANLVDDAEPPMVCRIQKDINLDEEDRLKGKSPSVWMLLAQAPDALGALRQSSRWQPARARPDLGVWTDDFSNLVSVLRWRD